MNGEDKRLLIFFLLSHHRPEKLHRTIRVGVHGKSLYLCARCTGVGAGAVSIFAAFFTGFVPTFWLYLLLLAVLPVPATFDWVTQSCELRESRNVIRIVTGYFLGVGWGLFFLSIVNGWLELFLFALLILGAYVFSIYVVARRTNFLDKYLI